jgi:carbon-monoxide dehydrogenase large subunit
VNAVTDAMAHAGVSHVEMPMTPDVVWEQLDAAGLAQEPVQNVTFELDEAGGSADD